MGEGTAGTNPTLSAIYTSGLTISSQQPRVYGVAKAFSTSSRVIIISIGSTGDS